MDGQKVQKSKLNIFDCTFGGVVQLLRRSFQLLRRSFQLLRHGIPRPHSETPCFASSGVSRTDDKSIQNGLLRGHGFDMGMIFANPPPCKPACMGNLIPQNMIFALKAKPLHGGGPMQVQNPYMGVDPCLISNFELSGHQFGTILKSFILTFQSASI